MNPLSECLLSVEVIDNGDHPIVRYAADNLVVYKIRRQRIEEARKRNDAASDKDDIRVFWNDLTSMGVYFYVGHSLIGPGLDVYIGEGGNVYNRLKTHRTDEWQNWTELLFVHRENMTMAVRSKLEDNCIRLTGMCADVNLINKKEGRAEEPTSLEVKMINSIMKSLPQLMYVAGYDFLLQGIQKTEKAHVPEQLRSDDRPLFFINSSDGYLGPGTVIDGEFWVCTGTRIKPRTKHFLKSDQRVYDDLLSNGTIVDDVFVQDWKPESHVIAARIVLGTTSGDMKYKWKTSESMTVDDYLRHENEDR